MCLMFCPVVKESQLATVLSLTVLVVGGVHNNSNVIIAMQASWIKQQTILAASTGVV